MQIAASKKTVYGFDHPAKGYACLLVVDRLAPDGYSWRLSDSLQRGKINLSALVDSDGCLVNNINHGGDGFFILKMKTFHNDDYLLMLDVFLRATMPYSFLIDDLLEDCWTY